MNGQRASIVGLCLVAGAATGFGATDGSLTNSTGPDLIVSDLQDVLHWGASPLGAIQAYSVGTYACNIGDQPAVWQGGTDQHPVIGANMFRLSEGRFEQIGQSWLKWAFVSENTTFCGDCVDPGTGSLLGVNCADPYEAVWNGYQLGLGPKSVVNPFTGEFPASHATPPATTIGGRLQVHTSDLVGTGSSYFLEGQYVSPDDSAAGNLYNNTSYRQVWMQPNYDLTYIGPGGVPSTTVQQQPAIAAWVEQDPTVFLGSADVPNDGRVYLARKATAIGGGTWHYEIAIQNLNSDRAVGGILIYLPTGAGATNLGFHDVDYHSGEVYDGTPWTGTITATGVLWQTVDYATDPNANALRWGTLYNFWFDAAEPPQSVTLAELQLFKPGSPASLEVPIGATSVLAGDLNCDGSVNFGDINPFVLILTNPGTWQTTYPGCPMANGDINGDGAMNFGDINPFVALLAG
jgi:hypothetical protein